MLHFIFDDISGSSVGSTAALLGFLPSRNRCDSATVSVSLYKRQLWFTAAIFNLLNESVAISSPLFFVLPEKRPFDPYSVSYLHI